jgi:hypothetical protein
MIPLPKRRKPKKPNRYVFHWVITYKEPDDTFWHAYSLGRRRPSLEHAYSVRIQFRNTKLTGMTGWDVDRHRFFVESHEHRYGKRTRFVERNRLRQLGFINNHLEYRSRYA